MTTTTYGCYRAVIPRKSTLARHWRGAQCWH